MKLLRLTGILLLVVAGITLVLSLILPAKQTIERTITIKAPAPLVYTHISRLDHFNSWAVWNRNDSTVKNELSGEDGTIGAASSWSGDPVLSGTGKIELTALEENKQVTQKIHFLTPRDGQASSTFFIDEKNGVTTVHWNFEMLTPRPWNVFNLFYKMEKAMGKDFEAGLANLKTQVEKSAGTETPALIVSKMNFPATTFAMIRQKIQVKDITSFFGTHTPLLYTAAGKNGITAGSPTGLYYEWNDRSGQVDMATAVPIPPGSTIEDPIIRITNISASKAVSVNYYGRYENIRDGYSSLDAHLAKQKLTRKYPVIEQYIIGPQQEADTAKWLTRIVYLVD